MEPEDSLPHPQVPATCPYSDPARSSPYPHIPLPEDPSQYYPIYVWVSQVFSLPQVSPPKTCVRLSSHPQALHAPSISFLSILSPEHYLVRSTNIDSLVLLSSQCSSPTLSAELKNECSSIFTPPYAFVACTGPNLFYLTLLNVIICLHIQAHKSISLPYTKLLYVLF